MRLLANNPLWIVLIVITLALHVGFAVALWRWTRGARSKPPPSPGDE